MSVRIVRFRKTRHTESLLNAVCGRQTWTHREVVSSGIETSSNIAMSGQFSWLDFVFAYIKEPGRQGCTENNITVIR